MKKPPELGGFLIVASEGFEPPWLTQLLFASNKQRKGNYEGARNDHYPDFNWHQNLTPFDWFQASTRFGVKITAPRTSQTIEFT